MRLAQYISKSKNYGSAGALSLMLLFITGIFSYVVYHFMAKDEE